MANEPSISIRKSIRWGDDAPFEDTSTLVLTTSHRHYVDIRIYLPTTNPSDVLPPNPSNSNDNHYSSSLAASPAKLEWGFAGQSRGTPAQWDGPRLISPAHGTWTHWVDSQKPDGYEDEGYMYDQHDGLTWEKGVMENPRTGEVMAYEEVWEDFAPRKGGLGEEGAEVVEVTLVYREEGSRAKGMVIRLGEWMQGILRDAGGGITVERWHCEDFDGKMEWKRQVRIGSGELPCQRLIDLNDLSGAEDIGWTILGDKSLV